MSLNVYLPAGCSVFVGQAYVAHRHLSLGVVSGCPLDRLDCPFPGLSAPRIWGLDLHSLLVGVGIGILLGPILDVLLPGQTIGGGYSSPAFGKLVAEEWWSLQDCLMSSAGPASSKDATQLAAEVVDDFREIKPLTRIRGNVKEACVGPAVLPMPESEEGEPEVGVEEATVWEEEGRDRN